MMTRIEYTCKFCSKHRVLECDIHPDCPPLDLIKWKALLVCNECADYESSRRKVERQIADQAVSLKTVRHGVKNEDKLKHLEASSRDNINALTRTFCRLICDRHRQLDWWEPEITESIMSDPDKVWSVLERVRKRIQPFCA